MTLWYLSRLTVFCPPSTVHCPLLTVNRVRGPDCGRVKPWTDIGFNHSPRSVLRILNTEVRPRISIIQLSHDPGLRVGIIINFDRQFILSTTGSTCEAALGDRPRLCGMLAHAPGASLTTSWRWCLRC